MSIPNLNSIIASRNQVATHECVTTTAEEFIQRAMRAEADRAELLEALVYARDEIAMRVKEDGGDAYSVRKACRKMDEAIAKAKGEM